MMKLTDEEAEEVEVLLTQLQLMPNAPPTPRLGMVWLAEHASSFAVMVVVVERKPYVIKSGACFTDATLMTLWGYWRERPTAPGHMPARFREGGSARMGST